MKYEDISNLYDTARATLGQMAVENFEGKRTHGERGVYVGIHTMRVSDKPSTTAELDFSLGKLADNYKVTEFESPEELEPELFERLERFFKHVVTKAIVGVDNQANCFEITLSTGLEWNHHITSFATFGSQPETLSRWHFRDGLGRKQIANKIFIETLCFCGEKHIFLLNEVREELREGIEETVQKVDLVELR